MTSTRPRTVALLPMKANSERVKGKNFRSFNGKPLFRWMLDTLLSIDEATFNELVYQNPDFGLAVVRLIAGRLSNDVSRLQQQSRPGQPGQKVRRS